MRSYWWVGIRDHRQHCGNCLVLRFRRDEWIIVLSGCLNISRAISRAAAKRTSPC